MNCSNCGHPEREHRWLAIHARRCLGITTWSGWSRIGRLMRPRPVQVCMCPQYVA